MMMLLLMVSLLAALQRAKRAVGGFPGGLVVENPPANEGDAV